VRVPVVVSFALVVVEAGPTLTVSALEAGDAEKSVLPW
jgi:riboflavin biosynthesis pyrimidine reductase